MPHPILWLAAAALAAAAPLGAPTARAQPAAPTAPAPARPGSGAPPVANPGTNPASATAAPAGTAPRRAAAPAPPAAGTAPLPVGRGAQPLTLEEAERRLLERNLTVLSSRYGVDLARAQRLVASSPPAATVSIGNTFAQVNESTRSSFQGGRFLGPQNNVNVGLSFLIERGGKRELRTRLADIQVSVAEIQVLDALRTQLFQLRQAFLQALQARANLEVALANRGSLDRTETLLRRQLADGAIPEGDLLRFQASRVQFEADVTSNALAYATAIAAVAVLLADDAAAFALGAGTRDALGLNARPQGGALAPIGPAAAAAPPAGGRPRPVGGIGAPTTVQTILSPVAFDVRGRFDRAPELGIGRDDLAASVVNRPDVVAALRQSNAQDANRLLAEAARYRDVTVGPSWNRTRLPQNLPVARDPNDLITGNNQFGISFSFPIFTSRIVEGNVGVAAAQASQAAAQARLAMLQARSDFATAWAAYEQGRALLGLYVGGALNRAEEAYRSTEAAYLAGGRSLIDVLDALRTLNSTRVAANNARYGYLLALAQLEQATGVIGLAPRL